MTPLFKATGESNTMVQSGLTYMLQANVYSLLYERKRLLIFFRLSNITYTSKALKYLTFIVRFLFNRNVVPVWSLVYQIIVTIVTSSNCSKHYFLGLLHSKLLMRVTHWCLYMGPSVKCLKWPRAELSATHSATDLTQKCRYMRPSYTTEMFLSNTSFNAVFAIYSCG